MYNRCISFSFIVIIQTASIPDSFIFLHSVERLIENF